MQHVRYFEVLRRSRSVRPVRLIAWIDLPVEGERSAGAVGLITSRQRRLPAEVSGIA
jgi:hypothetical protein